MLISELENILQIKSLCVECLSVTIREGSIKKNKLVNFSIRDDLPMKKYVKYA